MMKWQKIEDFRDAAYQASHGRRYELVVDDDIGDVTADEARSVRLPTGEQPSHVWISGGRWLAE